MFVECSLPVTCVSSGGYHGISDGSSSKTIVEYDQLIVAVGADANTFGIKVRILVNSE
jgi:NADH dehydrogenase FAD-containing subunit